MRLYLFILLFFVHACTPQKNRTITSFGQSEETKKLEREKKANRSTFESLSKIVFGKHKTTISDFIKSGKLDKLGEAVPSSLIAENAKDNLGKMQARKAWYLEQIEKQGKAREYFEKKWIVGRKLDKYRDTSVPDYDMVLSEILRYMYLVPTLQKPFVTVLEEFDYWIHDKPNNKVYWSENHMAMYLSSGVLASQLVTVKNARKIRERLQWFLEHKVKYGYYEFNSTTYIQFTARALLNLIDFCEDPLIRNLADQALNRLVHDLLLFTNSQGYMIAAAGRNYIIDLIFPDSSKLRNLMLLVTGSAGRLNSSEITAFAFATSKWQPKVETLEAWYKQGSTQISINHTTAELKQMYKNRPIDYQAAINFTQGLYAHPDVATINHSFFRKYPKTLQHDMFKPFQLMDLLGDALSTKVLSAAGTFTRGSRLNDLQVRIYKKDTLVLSAIEHYLPGYVGAQQVPWVATLGNKVFFTQNYGKEHRDELTHISNANLPNIHMEDNIAIIMYRKVAKAKPNYLHWPDIDETLEEGKWILGRNGPANIAIYKPCRAARDGYLVNCGDASQSWVVIVGDRTTYKDFASFATSIREKTEVKSENTQNVYRTHVHHENHVMEHSWPLTQKKMQRARDEL